MTAEILNRYAALAVRIGVNLQKAQALVILAPVETAPFARAIAAEAWAAGAADVHIEWEDEQAELLRYRLAPTETLASFPHWRVEAMEGLMHGGAAFLSIMANDPDLLHGVDPERVATANQARMVALADLQAKLASGQVAWSVVSVPTAGWAAKVSPDLPEPAQIDRLWELILKAVRLDTADPVAAWRSHLGELGARAAHMNGLRLRALRYTAPGTDLTVDLPEGHLWVCAPAVDPRGIPVVHNMPTEEIFTLPARDGVNGTVAATMPFSYQGALIEGMTVRFAEGRVVAAEARTGKESLERLLRTDDGAARLGEVALVPHGSAVSRLGTLFYNTLFDENAACHLALGRAYPRCLEGGEAMEPADLERRGANVSMEHVDFMIGSPDLDIDGVAADGAVIPVMRSGGWAFNL